MSEDVRWPWSLFDNVTLESERTKMLRERDELLKLLNSTVADHPGVSLRDLAHSLGIDDFQISVYHLLREDED